MRRPRIDRIEVRRLYAQGLNDHQIATKLNCHHITIGYIRHELSLPSNFNIRHLLPTEKQLAYRLYKEEKSDSFIAKQIGTSHVTIWGFRHKRGLKTKNQKLNELILQLYQQRKSVEEIASELQQPYEKIAVIVGHYLQDLCRQKLSCPFKALLPETSARELNKP